jgi:hypothetical protein
MRRQGEGIASKLSRAFDKPGLPGFDAFMTIINDVEATFRKNKADG